jgi:hypothetical protein
VLMSVIAPLALTVLASLFGPGLAASVENLIMESRKRVRH